MTRWLVIPFLMLGLAACGSHHCNPIMLFACAT